LPQEENKLKFFIEPLAKEHDRAAFSCGVKALDQYLQRQATQDVKKHVAVVFVLTPDGKTIAGFYTLSQYAVELDVIPEEIARKLPRYPHVPATLVGRLAVSANFRGQGLGERLLMDALCRCFNGSRQLASAAVVVDAKDDNAVAFYRKYGFLELPKVARRLFLPMGTIEELFG
jgi:ribosomal protein S18 acetylase RimI-like enzyme